VLALPDGRRRRIRVSAETVSKTTDVPSTTPERIWLVPMLLLVTLPVLALDQISKHWISSTFALYQSRPLISGWLDLTFTLNPGAAFSLFATMPQAFRHFFFITLSFVAIIVLTVLLAKHSTPLSSAIAFALILGGTIGNLIDRLTIGRVVDFIYFHHAWFSYPVFNLADSAITTGVAIVLLFSFLESRKTDHT
jgi:signal peptidase II